MKKRISVGQGNGERTTFFPRGSLWVILLLGLAIRLVDLTDLPLDFHPNKQLRSAMMARGMYYADLPSASDWQREMAVTQWHGMERLEPPILETVTAWTYRLAGGEHLWIGRLYSSLLWVVGGLFLFLTARTLSNNDGALVGVAYYLFLPYAVIASRSFQADPFMVAAALAGVWALVRWSGQPDPSWRSTVAAGLIAALAPFVKVLIVFSMIGALVGLLLATRGAKKTLRDPKAWAVMALMLLPSVAYYLVGTLVAGQLAGNTTRFFPSMLVSLRFYLDWSELATWVAGPIAISAFLLGLVVSSARGRGLLIGLGLGYVACGLVFPYHFSTHDYYHLALIPILALGISPVASSLVRGVTENAGGRVARILALGVFAIAIAFGLREARGRMAARDFRAEAGYWEYLGELVGHSSNLVALSHDYGYRLEYYGWTLTRPWPAQIDFRLDALFGGQPETSEAWIQGQLSGHSYFVTTLLGELEAQPGVAAYLHSHYPVYASGDDFIIFDLQHPLPEGS